MSDEVEKGDVASAESDASAAKPKRSKLVVIGGIVAVLAVLGGGAWWMMRKPAEAAAPEAPKASERGLVQFEPFVVNLSDGDGAHYLRVSLQLVVASEEEAKHVTESKVLLMQARSAILETLSQQSSAGLLSTD